MNSPQPEFQQHSRQSKHVLVGASPALLDIHAVSQRVSFCPTHVFDLVRENRFPKPIKIGRSSRWLASDIDRWIELQVTLNGLQFQTYDPVARMPAPPASTGKYSHGRSTKKSPAARGGAL
jgi:prophage regulatory protein